MNIFTGLKTLEEKESKFNGKVSVIKSIAWGTYIQVNGLTQSGGVVNGVWKSTLKNIKRKNLEIKKILILGLGGGSVAILSQKFWKDAKIVGVDIDPVMVDMGRKHLGLNKLEMEIHIGDAFKYLKANKDKYDLVIIDMYKGDEVPGELKSDEFLEIIKANLDEKGIAVFNRLYFGEKRPEAMRFGEKLQKFFSKVEYFYPEANLMFISSNSEKQGSNSNY